MLIKSTSCSSDILDKLPTCTRCPYFSNCNNFLLNYPHFIKRFLVSVTDIYLTLPIAVLNDFLLVKLN